MEENTFIEQVNTEEENLKEITLEANIDIEAKNILNKIANQPSLDLDKNLDNEELIRLFNNNQLKKTMQRILKSNQLLDAVTEQALKRFIDNPNDFSNNELLNYMKVVQDSINNSQRTLSTQQEKINTPLIQINQIDAKDNYLSEDSKKKILYVVDELLKSIESSNNQDNIIDGEIEILNKNEGE